MYYAGVLMKLLKILAATGVSEILLALEKKPLYFGELIKSLKYDRKSTSSSLATRRLRTLEGLAIVVREVQQDRKRRVRYSLTKRGRQVIRLLSEFEKLEKGIFS